MKVLRKGLWNRVKKICKELSCSSVIRTRKKPCVYYQNIKCLLIPASLALKLNFLGHIKFDGHMIVLVLL